MMIRGGSVKKKVKKCDYCFNPLGEVYFTDSKTKQNFHLNINGKDCLSKFTSTLK